MTSERTRRTALFLLLLPTSMLKGTVHLAIANLDCKSIPRQQLSSLIAVWNGQPKSNKRNKRKKEGTKAITELGEAPLSLILPQAEGSGDC